jgi:hypothetical protein
LALKAKAKRKAQRAKLKVLLLKVERGNLKVFQKSPLFVGVLETGRGEFPL